MSPVDRASLHFVRLLLRGGEARRGADGIFRLNAAGRAAALAAPKVAALISAGVLAGDGGLCHASQETSAWLRRRLAGDDAFATQHRDCVRRADGGVINLVESPLARLAVASAGEAEAFLAAWQVEAGERLRRLVERAQLRTRVTMSYDGAPASRSRGGQGAGELSDMAADARRAVAEVARLLPRDCADVVFDICGFLKGLQQVETERGWPRRSAKLVLRIGLDQLARHWGLVPVAAAASRGKIWSWIDQGGRAERFEPSANAGMSPAGIAHHPAESVKPAPTPRSEYD